VAIILTVLDRNLDSVVKAYIDKNKWEMDPCATKKLQAARVSLEKLTVVNVVKKFSAFLKLGGPSCSQELTIKPILSQFIVVHNLTK
jgi:hypothetical protein